jgi:ribonucleoside-diphosphate reductase alpha chain
MIIYSKEEALKKSTEYFNGDTLAADVFITKYALRNDKLELVECTPDQMHRRLAKEFARIEKKYPNPLSEEEIFNLFDRFKYMCVSGDNWITTTEGAKQIKDLVGKHFYVNVDGVYYSSAPNGFVITGQKQTYRVITKEGYNFIATSDHPIAVHKNLGYWLKKKHIKWVNVSELKIDNPIVINNNRNNYWDGDGNFDEGWLLGQLVGNGGSFRVSTIATLSFKNTDISENFEKGLEIISRVLYKNSSIPYFKDCENDNKNTKVIASKELAVLANRFGIKMGDKFNTLMVERSSFNFYCGFLSGLFDADSYVQNRINIKGDTSITLTSYNLEFLSSIQRMLCRIGIISKIYKFRQPSRSKSICGSKGHHDLRISKDNIVEFCKKVNFQFRKNCEILNKITNITHRSERFFARVESVELYKVEDVYDCTIPIANAFDCNGVLVHNCPQGSPMFGIGNPYQKVSLSNCIHGESLVYTKELGLIKMKDVKENLHVLTHMNRFRRVLKHVSKGIKETYTLSRTFGNKKVNIRDEQEMGRFLSVTEDHKLYTLDEQWRGVGEIIRSHQPRLPQPKIEYFGNVPDLFPLTEGRHVFVDKDFCWLAGLYLAEGAIKRIKTNAPSVYFTVSTEETSYADRISTYTESVLGNKAWVQTWKEYNFIQINIFSPPFANLIDNLFGHSFDKKRLPEWVFGLSAENKESLLDGFLSGDATNYESLDDNKIFFAIANPTLAYELGLLARSIGKGVRFNFLTKGKLIKHRTISVTFSKEQDIIKFTKSPVPVEVFDMEVEEDNSFVAGDIICHNCFALDVVDSYGGICWADERIAQISKRRGGCVEENSFVKIKNRGVLKIKYINIGDKILSYNIENKKSEYSSVLDKYYTDVKKENQIKITLINGFEISTSKTHPILILQDGEYKYVKARELKKNNICIIPETQNISSNELLDFDKELINIGWFIGAHTGDGTVGEIKKYGGSQVPKKYINKKIPKLLRIRIVGDNENVIKEFAQICNNITESNSQYIVSRRKSYKTKCWEYCNNTKALFPLVKKYFDNKIGSKCYDCHVFSFIEKNNLWLPYLAGLIDTDGYVRGDGKIDLCLCAKDIICKLSSVLGGLGIRTFITTRFPKRDNEKAIYRLIITDENFYSIISPYLRHDLKRKTLEDAILTKRLFSHTYPFTKEEIKNIIKEYDGRRYHRDILKDKKHTNMMAIIALLKKYNAVGLGGLMVFKEYNLLTQDKIIEILQRIKIKHIKKEDEDFKYIDLSVENNNNYYSGSRGLINIHNCGLDISPLRPKGQPTKNSALTTDGIVVFMERFSNTSREVAQSGRRGALLQSISVHHPEVLNFIRAKLDLKKVTGANISVRITDEFMDAVQKDKTYEQRWPVDSDKPVISNKVHAREVWNEIIKCAHHSGEPGILFWNSMIDFSPADSYSDVGFKTQTTNPCGELGLNAPGGSCILLLQKLTSYISNPFTPDAKLNKDLLIKNTGIAQKLIDDMVDLEIEAIEKIIEKVKSDPEPDKIKTNELDLWKNVKDVAIKGRRTGLGVTGLGDCIAMMNVKYGSEESLKLVKEIFSIIRDEAYRSSIVMAKDRGSFPIWDHKKEQDNKFLNRLPDDILKEMKKNGRRNIACLTISPAGSVSILTQTTSGFEPVFLAEYTRKRKLTDNDKEKPDFVDELGDKWKEYKIQHHGLKLYNKITGKEFKDSPYYKSQAGDIDYEMRIKMQAMAQKYICHSISSTVNLPNNTTIKTVDKLYMTAWEEGLKGLTFYRDGSRDGVLTKDSSGKQCEDCDEASKTLRELVQSGKRPSKIILSPAPKRPEIMECEIQRSKVGGGDWLFFVGILDKQPYEIFGGDAEQFTIPFKYKSGWIIKNGKNKDGVTQYNLVLGSLTDENEKLEFKGIAKHFNNKEYGAFTRVLSLSLRHGVPIKHICEQLIKTGCAGELFSFQRAISRILKKYIADGEVAGSDCPICHSSELYYKNGCPVCKICGHSNCM